MAAQCMLVLELTRVVPDWSSWLAFDVLYISPEGLIAEVRAACGGASPPWCLPLLNISR
jgi:hypothetical protein